MTRELARRTMLRGFVAIAATLAATAFVFGMFPGVEVYHGDVFIETRAVVEHWNWLLGIFVVGLAPGAIVWRTGQLGHALLWSMWTIAVSVFVFVATFDLGDWSIRTVALWPQAVFGYLVFALMFLLIAVIPVACGAFWLVTRDRPLPPPTLPRARLVKSRA